MMNDNGGVGQVLYYCGKVLQVTDRNKQQQSKDIQDDDDDYDDLWRQRVILFNDITNSQQTNVTYVPTSSYLPIFVRPRLHDSHLIDEWLGAVTSIQPVS